MIRGVNLNIWAFTLAEPIVHDTPRCGHCMCRCSLSKERNKMQKRTKVVLYIVGAAMAKRIIKVAGFWVICHSKTLNTIILMIKVICQKLSCY